MTDQLVALVIDYGAIGLLLLLAVNCFGLPMPTGLMMLAVGSIIDQGDLNLPPLLAGGIAGAVIGDFAGYGVGRFWGGWVQSRVQSRPWMAGALSQAESFENRWGDIGIFLSRWLLTPLGPWVNVIAGLTGYSPIRFLFWDILGESLWVAIYLGLGVAFSRSVQNLSQLLGDFTWLAVFGAIAIYVGWLVFGRSSGRDGRLSF